MWAKHTVGICSELRCICSCLATFHGLKVSILGTQSQNDYESKDYKLVRLKVHDCPKNIFRRQLGWFSLVAMRPQFGQKRRQRQSFYVEIATSALLPYSKLREEQKKKETFAWSCSLTFLVFTFYTNLLWSILVDLA